MGRRCLFMFCIGFCLGIGIIFVFFYDGGRRFLRYDELKMFVIGFVKRFVFFFNIYFGISLGLCVLVLFSFINFLKIDFFDIIKVGCWVALLVGFMA